MGDRDSMINNLTDGNENAKVSIILNSYDETLSAVDNATNIVANSEINRDDIISTLKHLKSFKDEYPSAVLQLSNKSSRNKLNLTTDIFDFITKLMPTMRLKLLI